MGSKNKNLKFRKILIIGAGSIGIRHLKNLLFLGYNNLAICDPDKDRQKAIKDIADLPFYSAPEEAIKKEEPQIIFICSPTSLHLKHLNLALEKSVDIFVEKPLSSNLSGVDDVIKKAVKRKSVVMVACNFKFHKGMQMLAEELQKNSYNNPLLARVVLGYYLPDARKKTDYKKNYAAQKDGGGVILDSGIHVINYLESLMGEIDRVMAVEGKTKNLGINSEESAQLTFVHKTGGISSVSLDYLSRRPIHRIEIITKQKLFVLDLKEDLLVSDDGKIKKVLYKGDGDVNRMFVDELRHFFECIESRKETVQGLKEAGAYLTKIIRADKLN